jgi:hypothetical protein
LTHQLKKLSMPWELGCEMPARTHPRDASIVHSNSQG